MTRGPVDRSAERIPATAELNGLTVLHYDHDFPLIAEVTGKPEQWVVPAGSA